MANVAFAFYSVVEWTRNLS